MSSPSRFSSLHRVARLSSTRLAEALDELTLRHGTNTVIDLRADGYGHGADEIENRARAAGVAQFARTSDELHDLQEHAGSASCADATLIYGFDGTREPLLSLEGEVIATKHVPEGTAVSYGYRYRTPQPTTLALVGLGYADGVPRSVSSCRAPRTKSLLADMAGSGKAPQIGFRAGKSTS